MSDTATPKTAELLDLLLTPWKNHQTKLQRVEALLAGGADPNGCDAQGIPAIFHAVGVYNKNMPGDFVKTLIAAGADPKAVDGEGRNAFFHAYESRNIRALVEAGVPILQPDKHGVTIHDYYYDIAQDITDPPLDDPREPMQLHWIATTVEAYTWIEKSFADGELTYGKWLEQLGAAKQLADYETNTELRAAQDYFWQSAFPWALKRCHDAGEVQRDELFTPESVRWLGAAMAASTQLASDVQRFCDEAGAPLHGEEVMGSGLGEPMQRARNLHNLFGFDYWKDKEWPEMLSFLKTLPQDTQDALFAENNSAALFVPHLRRWLESEEAAGLDTLEFSRKLREAPEPVLQKIGNWRQIVMHRARSEQAQGLEGRA